MFRFILNKNRQSSFLTTTTTTTRNSTKLASSKRFHASCCGGHGHSHGSSSSGGDDYSPHPSHVAEFFSQNQHLAKANPDIERCKNLTWVGAGVNIVYCVLKIGLGTTGGSVALVADGLHAVVDVASDGVALGSLYLARQPKLAKRCRFPFGTGRAETVGALIIAAVLTLGAFSVAWAAIEKLFDYAANPEKQNNKNKDEQHHHHGHGHSHSHHDHDHSGLNIFAHEHHFEILKEDTEGLALRDRIIWSMLFVAASSIVAKETLYRLMKRAAEKAGSASTLANAYHHRADAMSAGLGLLGVVSSAYGLELLDAFAGLGVSAVILQLGLRTLKGSTLQFFDYQGGDLKSIRNVARGTSKMGTAVNVFATRHGLQVVLHGTLLVKKEATCADVAHLESMILDKVTKEHPNVLFDVFFKVRPYTTDGDVEDKKKKANNLTIEEKNTNISDLRMALDVIAQFHGLELFDPTSNNKNETSSSSSYLLVVQDDEEKTLQLLVPRNQAAVEKVSLGEDCEGDLKRCCELFGYQFSLGVQDE